VLPPQSGNLIKKSGLVTDHKAIERLQIGTEDVMAITVGLNGNIAAKQTTEMQRHYVVEWRVLQEKFSSVH
jgi:hypothetical protein